MTNSQILAADIVSRVQGSADSSMNLSQMVAGMLEEYVRERDIKDAAVAIRNAFNNVKKMNSK